MLFLHKLRNVFDVVSIDFLPKVGRWKTHGKNSLSNIREIKVVTVLLQPVSLA